MYSIWNKQDNLNLAEGNLSPEQVMNHPSFAFTRGTPVVINTVRGRVTEIHSLAVLADAYNIPEELSDEDALVFFVNALEAERNKVPEPTAEERIAAAMEFQNIMSL